MKKIVQQKPATFWFRSNTPKSESGSSGCLGFVQAQPFHGRALQRNRHGFFFGIEMPEAVDAFAPQTGVLVAAKRKTQVQVHGRVDQHHAGLNLTCGLPALLQVTRPQIGNQTKAGFVGQRDGFFKLVKYLNGDEGPEDFFLANPPDQYSIGTNSSCNSALPIDSHYMDRMFRVLILVLTQC